MRYFLFLIMMAAFGQGAYGQGDSLRVWNKWCEKVDTPLLFNTANNVIQIYCVGVKPHELTVKSLDYTLKIGTPEIKGDTISVMAMPHAKAGKKMRLAILNKKTQKVLKTVVFSSDDVPAPVGRVGTIKTPDALRKEILLQTALRVAFPNSLYSFPYRIKQYTFRVKYDKTDISIPVAGFMIPREVLVEIKRAPDGAFIEFTDIKATCPECATRTLDNFKLRIR